MNLCGPLTFGRLLAMGRRLEKIMAECEAIEDEYDYDTCPAEVRTRYDDLCAEADAIRGRLPG